MQRVLIIWCLYAKWLGILTGRVGCGPTQRVGWMRPRVGGGGLVVADVVVAEVIRHDHQDVRLLWCGAGASDDQREHVKEAHHRVVPGMRLGENNDFAVNSTPPTEIARRTCSRTSPDVSHTTVHLSAAHGTGIVRRCACGAHADSENSRCLADNCMPR